MGDPKDEERSHEVSEPDNSQIFKNLEQFTAKNDTSTVININSS